MRPSPRARPEYVAAFVQLVGRITEAIGKSSKPRAPLQMYVAGGAALHLYIGERISRDIDAVFSHRIALPENLEVVYPGADGAITVLYFDRQYSDTLALMHEDAYEDSKILVLPGIDAKVLEVRLLSPLDLAVSKLSRFSSQDRDDIVTLAREGLVNSKQLRRRAEDALAGYVGDIPRLKGSIDIACRLMDEAAGRAKRK